MSQDPRGLRAKLRLSVGGRVRHFCGKHMEHVRDGLEVLTVGGMTLDEWVKVVCPEGIGDLWVEVEVRWEDGMFASGRIQSGDDGGLWVDSGLGEIDRDSWDEARPPLMLPAAIVTMVAMARVTYGAADLAAWMKHHGHSAGLPLGPGGAGSRRGEKPWALSAEDWRWLVDLEGRLPRSGDN